MTEEDIKSKIQNLTDELTLYNYQYYVLDSPTVSDFKFDTLLKQLQLLEKQYPQYANPNSPTKRVGGEITKNFKTKTHAHRMYSLDNVYSKEELLSWINRIEKIAEEKVEFVCELKYDGVSISITYIKGELVEAVTRGDGVAGDVVTENIKTIKTIPLRLNNINYPTEFYMRGEVILDKDGFSKLNREREKQGLELYANPRNTASGSLKLQDSAEAAKRPLSCFLYGIMGDRLTFKTQEEMLKFAHTAGFLVPQTYSLCENIDKVIDFINKWEDKRKELPYETDGVVVKVNRLDQQEKLGYTAKSPRWAVAYKFAGEKVQTKIKSIDYQVGRTGVITPVANLNPVLIGGTVVKRASLHNQDIIESLDLHMGDTVFVEKGGEIIPKVVGTNFNLRPAYAKKIEFIKNCPSCGTPLEKKQDEAQHFCPNTNSCPPQITGRIEHFVSRKAMNIDSVGAETILLLYQAGLVKNIADLYDLRIDQLLPLERMAEKSAMNILEGMEESKSIPFHKVLYALGIKHVGETIAKKLVNYFKDIESLIQAKEEELVGVGDVGEKIAASLVEYFSNEKNIEIINRLKIKGIQFKEEIDKKQKEKNILNGKTFLFTGKLTMFTREGAEQMVEEHGGVNISAVSSKLDYLVVGENAGSKLKKANDLQTITILDEAQFLAMLER